MILPIVTHPNDAMLRKETELISIAALKDPELQSFFDDMIATMHAANGIGIAAPQVNRSIRATILNKEAFPKRFLVGGQEVRNDVVLINPKWERTSKKSDVDIEGCLSIPGKLGRVKRWKDITVQAFDRNGKLLVFQAHGYLARVIQHEVDHLDGVLYIDRTNDMWDE